MSSKSTISRISTQLRPFNLFYQITARPLYLQQRRQIRDGMVHSGRLGYQG